MKQVLLLMYLNLKEEFNEKMLGFECSLLSEKALAKDWLSKEDEEAFAYLQ